MCLDECTTGCGFVRRDHPDPAPLLRQVLFSAEGHTWCLLGSFLTEDAMFAKLLQFVQSLYDRVARSRRIMGKDDLLLRYRLWNALR